MTTTDNNTRSAFHPLNELLGGYAPGTVTIIRTLDGEFEQGSLQDFIFAETQGFAFNRISTLFVSLDLDDREFCKALMTDTSGGQPEIIPETDMKLLNDAELWFTGKINKNKETTLNDILETIKSFPKKYAPRAIIIDSIEKAIPQDEDNFRSGIQFLDRLIALAKRMKAFVIISDYGNRLAAGYPRQDGITEIEIKTTLDDIIQAKVINNHVYETVTDIRRKSILEIPLKASGLAS